MTTVRDRLSTLRRYVAALDGRAAEQSAGRLRWVGLALVVLFWGAVAYAGWRLLVG